MDFLNHWKSIFKIKLNIALNANSEEPKKLNTFVMIAGEKLNKIMGSSEDLHIEITKEKKKHYDTIWCDYS